MACDLTAARAEPCKDVLAGLDAVYFINWGDNPYSGITFDATNTDVIETLNGIPSSVTAYKYELKADANSFEQTIVSSRENGTTMFEQVLNLTLKKQDLATHKEIKLLAYGRPHVVVRDRNNNYFYMGAEWGAEVTGGTIVTGGAMGDLNGYTLTLTAQERIPAPFLEATNEAGLATAGLSITSA